MWKVKMARASQGGKDREGGQHNYHGEVQQGIYTIKGIVHTNSHSYGEYDPRSAANVAATQEHTEHPKRR